jgi:hypothetical protein
MKTLNILAIVLSAYCIVITLATWDEQVKESNLPTGSENPSLTPT